MNRSTFIPDYTSSTSRRISSGGIASVESTLLLLWWWCETRQLVPATARSFAGPLYRKLNPRARGVSGHERKWAESILRQDTMARTTSSSSRPGTDMKNLRQLWTIPNSHYTVYNTPVSTEMMDVLSHLGSAPNGRLLNRKFALLVKHR